MRRTLVIGLTLLVSLAVLAGVRARYQRVRFQQAAAMAAATADEGQAQCADLGCRGRGQCGDPQRCRGGGQAPCADFPGCRGRGQAQCADSPGCRGDRKAPARFAGMEPPDAPGGL